MDAPKPDPSSKEDSPPAQAAAAPPADEASAAAAPAEAAAPAPAAAPAGTPQSALTSSQRVATMIAALLGTFLAALDSTIVSNAGPAIIRDLKISPTLYDWLTTAYFLGTTVFIPVWGKASDIKGRRPILLAGIGVFLLGSLGCALSPGFVTLVLFRGLQGIGAAALLSTPYAVIADLFPPAVRSKYTGLFAAVWGLSAVIGPLLGGIITESLSWQWVFLVNLPIGALAVGFIVARMPALGGGLAARIDVRSVLALCAAVIPLLLALTFGRAGGAEEAGVIPPSRWGEPLVLALLAGSVLGIALFVVVQRKSPSPVIDLRHFKTPVFRWSTLSTSILGMAYHAGVLYAPLFMQRVLGKSPTDAGLVLIPLSLGVVLGNIAAGQIASRRGHYKPVMLFAAALGVATLSWLALSLEQGVSTTMLTVQVALLGLSLGPQVPLYVLAIQNGMPKQLTGSVTGSATFFRLIGVTLGTAIFGVVFAAVFTSQGAAVLPAQAMTRAVTAVFWLGAAQTAVALVTTLLIPALELKKK